MSIIRVKSDFRTIQDAVRAAVPGDAIIIESGIYHESVTVNKDSIRITGDGLVIIDGAFELSCGITVENAAGVMLQSLKIVNFNTYGICMNNGYDNGAVCCRTDNCIISGIAVMSSSGCRLIYCTAGGNGYNGIELIDTANTLVEHCLLKSNGNCGIEGRSPTGMTELVSNEIRMNLNCGASFSGGAPVRLINNCIADNMTSGCLITDPLSEIRGNIVSGNTDAGLAVFGRGCTIVRNSISEQGGLGLYISDGCSVTNNNIYDNGTFGLYVAGVNNTVECNDFIGNKDADIIRINPKNSFYKNDFATSIPYSLQTCPETV